MVMMICTYIKAKYMEDYTNRLLDDGKGRNYKNY